jgi:hypothetical protein
MSTAHGRWAEKVLQAKAAPCVQAESSPISGRLCLPTYVWRIVRTPRLHGDRKRNNRLIAIRDEFLPAPCQHGRLESDFHHEEHEDARRENTARWIFQNFVLFVLFVVKEFSELPISMGNHAPRPSGSFRLKPGGAPDKAVVASFVLRTRFLAVSVQLGFNAKTQGRRDARRERNILPRTALIDW